MVHPSPAADGASSLPQPPAAASSSIDDDNAVAATRRNSSLRYTYVPFDVLDVDWLGDPRLLKLCPPSQSSSSSSSSIMMMTRNGRGEVVEINDRAIGENDHRLARGYSPGTLVWVLLSRGGRCHNRRTSDDAPIQCGGDALALHKKRRDKKNTRRIVVDDDEEENGRYEEGGDDHDEPNVATMNYSRKEFFLRARVVSDDEIFAAPSLSSPNSTSYSTSSSEGRDPMGNGMSDDGRDRRRVLVRYSGGSTYRVRAYNLVPVLESRIHISTPRIVPPLVVVVPETNIYRRVAKVHAAPGDTFLEIGCDYGITVDRVRCSLASGGDVPLEWPEFTTATTTTTTSVGGENEECDDGCIDSRDGDDSIEIGGVGRGTLCLGVDKSIESIDIANRRYPECEFVHGDVLLPNEMSRVREHCELHLANKSPSVICVDINGNRDIDGVLECLRAIMHEPWSRMPRLIIVKSRFLYWEMKKGGVK